mmetsp:Transcript_36615/g.42089  ORF Transcript_36615/g.42089 Transcript_36615/m.42089 type:complete len:905 (-) Transcript_36615:314-3028(-)
MATDGPPSSAFSRPTSTIVSPSNQHSPSNDDLNSRWRHEDYETGKKASTSNTTNKSKLIIPAMDEENNNNSKNNSKDGEYNNYKLYETPEKLERSSSTASSSRSSLAGRKLYSTGTNSSNLSTPVDNSRRTYSFNRSSSYDTDALIRKYGGISGIPASMPSAAPPVAPSSQSLSNSSHSSSSSLSKSVREEAMKVLEIKDSTAADVNVNQPFNVRRTESGGFRCNAIPMDEAGDHDIAPDAIQPYYATKQKSKQPRTPSALAGLGLSERGSSQRNSSSSSAASWKSARMSFSDPKFREDDLVDEEEEENFDIVGPAGGDPENEGVELSARNNIMSSSSSYRDHPTAPGGGSHGSPTGSSFDDVEFDGDYPRSGGSSGLHPPSSTGGTGSSSWSSRYSDNPRMSNTNLLDRWDQKSAATSPEKRQSARNMFMSTASSMREAAGNVSKSVSSAAADGSRKFGKGFSFKKSSSFRMNDIKEAAAARERDEANNLRTVWKNDDTFQDEHSNVSSSSAARSPPRKGGETCGSRVRNALSCVNSSNHGGDRKHKSWEDVVHEKKRRRTILLAIICAVLGIIIISVSVTETRDTWKTKHVFDGSDKGMEVIFYATSNTDGSATNSGTSPQQLEQDLHTIPVDAEFLTHLGNLQDASLTQCPANRNEEVASILKMSPVPVFIVPGEHDWLHCPNQNYAYTRWLEAFAQFTETAFVDTLAMEVFRPKTTPEVFATLHNGVLLLGLHVVSGSLQGVGQQTSGDQELIMKDEKMKIFVRGTLEQWRGQFRAVVLLGNARPSQQQYSFFTGIAPALRDSKTPVLYLHSDSNGAGTTEHYPFHFAAPTTPVSTTAVERSGGTGGADNEKEDKQQQKQDREIQEYLQQILAVQVPNGGRGQAPVRITIGFGKTPFHIG